MTTDKREQIWVGAVVVVAAAILIVVVLAVSFSLHGSGTPHRTYFKYAAGLASGAAVRYGGLLAGNVEKVRVDPQNSDRIEIELKVRPEIPVKTDSVAKITSIGALGEMYLEITMGSKGAPLAPPGSVLASHETMTISDLGDMVNELAPVAEKVLVSLNDRLVEAKTTIARINDVLDDSNRQNISASLANVNAMLNDVRPKMEATLANVQTATDRLPAISKNLLAASERITPVLDDLKATIKQGNDTLAHVDALVVENRPDIRALLVQMRKTLDTTNLAMDQLRSTMDRNGENLDESLANVRAATDNLKDLTDTVKRKPSVLIRGETGKDRLPGGTK